MFFKKRGAALLRKAREEMGQQLLVLQMVLCFLTLVACACVFFPLAHISKNFGGEYCLLYAKVIFKWNGVRNVSVDDSKSVFNNASTCNYTLYLHVCMAITSAMFIWFAVHSKVTKEDKEGTGLRLLLPMAVFHIVFFICMVAAGVEITMGFSSWCDYMERNNVYKGQKYSCSDFEKFTWTPRGMTKIYTYSVLAETCTWIATVLIACQISVSCLHVVKTIKAELEAAQTEAAIETLVKDVDSKSTQSLHGSEEEAEEASSTPGSMGDVADVVIEKDPDPKLEHSDVGARGEEMADGGKPSIPPAGQVLTQAMVHSSESLAEDRSDAESSGKEKVTDNDTSMLIR